MIIGRIEVIERKIVVFKVDVEIGMDKIVIDEMKDNEGNIVEVEIEERVWKIDFWNGWRIFMNE